MLCQFTNLIARGRLVEYKRKEYLMNYYIAKDLETAVLAEWITRSGAPRFTLASPIVQSHLLALSGLRRAGGLVIDAPTAAMASNVIRRMLDPAYDPERFGTVAAATTIIPVDMFHQFDVWGRGKGHAVTPESMRPKVTQTLRRIIARLPERGIRPNIAVQATAKGLAITAYRLA